MSLHEVENFQKGNARRNACLNLRERVKVLVKNTVKPLVSLAVS